MAELPYLPIATDALIADTTHMTAEQFGAYVRLLMAMWRNGGTLPDNGGAELARMSGISPKRWDAISEPILRPLTITDGILTQKRLSKTWDHVNRKRVKLKMAADERWRRKRHANAYPNAMLSDAPPNAMLTKTIKELTTTFSGTARASENATKSTKSISPTDDLATVIAKKGWVQS